MSILDALEEPARRLPSWRPGVPTRLADGRVWHLAPIRLDLGEIFLGSGGAFGVPRLVLDDAPPGFDRYDDTIARILDEFDRLEGRCDPDAVAERHLVVCEAALPRLAALYDLTDVEAVALLVPRVAMLQAEPARALAVMEDVAAAVLADVDRLAEAIRATEEALAN